MPNRKKQMTGAEMVIRALLENDIECIFGYPGGAVLPIYDALFQQHKLRHVMVRHEQAAVHAAEGYARSTGKIGAVLVTSGPGATNAVTGLANAYMDSTPIICLTGQVATGLIGNDAFQECDITGITRPCTKHNYLVRRVDTLAETVHKAIYIARSGRPGPVLVDIPKDVQFDTGVYVPMDRNRTHPTYRPRIKPDRDSIARACALIKKARKPVVYAGGGVINSGAGAVRELGRLLGMTDFPIASTLMGIGAVPCDGKNNLGMLGMHGTYEANLAMYESDLILAVGARFDDRVTCNVEGFSPRAKKIHIDIDPSSINKSVEVDVPVIGDVEAALKEIVKTLKAGGFERPDLRGWWKRIAELRAVKSLDYEPDKKEILPQYAIGRLGEIARKYDPYYTTDVGQHQMWAAQFLPVEKPNRFMTSGGLGTMGYGLPAALGVQVAHPDSLVIAVTGEGSIQMNLQEFSTAVQYRLPVKVVIINNGYLGMVRQWQQLLHGSRYSESYCDSLPNFAKLAEAFGGTGLSADKPEELDDVYEEMIAAKGFVIACIKVKWNENCFPMIPAGASHNEVILGPDGKGGVRRAGDGRGVLLV